MKIVFAILLGFLSGFLVYMAISMLVLPGSKDPGTVLIPALSGFILAWILST